MNTTPEGRIGILSFDEARDALGGRLPNVFEKYKFEEGGIVLTEGCLPRVAVYVASGEGFSWFRRRPLLDFLHPSLEEKGAFILDPFAMCGQFLTPGLFEFSRPYAEIRRDWEEFNKAVVAVNYGLAIPRSGLVFAVCEGVPVDEGVAAEMAYAENNFIPVVAARSDFRPAENIASGLNPAVRAFARGNGKHEGGYFESPIEGVAYRNAFNTVEKVIQQKLQAWNKKHLGLSR